MGTLDTLDVDAVVVAGRDWGGLASWNRPLLCPARIRTAVGAGMPPMVRASASPTRPFEQVFGNRVFYVHSCQEPRVAETDIEANVRRILQLFMASASGDA